MYEGYPSWEHKAACLCFKLQTIHTRDSPLPDTTAHILGGGEETGTVSQKSGTQPLAATPV